MKLKLENITDIKALLTMYSKTGKYRISPLRNGEVDNELEYKLGRPFTDAEKRLMSRLYLVVNTYISEVWLTTEEDFEMLRLATTLSRKLLK